MMSRGGLVILFFGFFCSVFSQSYVSSGIRHFEAKEYAAALEDFQEAEKIKDVFTKDAIGRLYFYLGMTNYQLLASDQPEDQIMVVHDYLNRAINIDSSWSDQSSEVFADLASGIIKRADSQYKKASKTKDEQAKIAGLTEYIRLLTLSLQFRADGEVELLEALAYQQLGDVYFQKTDDIIALDRAGAHYKKAIELYEIARYNDPYSKDIIRSILELAIRIDDPQRVEEYTKLLKLAGG